MATTLSTYFKSLFNDEVAKRDGGKKAVLAQDGYEAAAFSKDRSTIYTTSPEANEKPSVYTRNEISRLSRYLVNNFALAERLLSVSEIYGVGSGLIANATTSDAVFNEASTKAFDRWANTAFCSSNKAINFYEMQKIMVRELLLTGEVFLVMEKATTGRAQLRLVSSENVKHSGEATDKSIDGLYLDDYGVVTAYNIFSGKNYIKVNAGDVIHLIKHKQANQLRGIGAFAASLNTMRDYKDLQLLEKKAIKTHSALAVQIERKSGDAGSGTLGDLIPSTATGANVPSSVPTNIAAERAFGGSVIHTQEGEKLSLLTSNRATDGFLKFIDLMIRDVCLNISIPYEFAYNSERLTGTGVRFALSDAAFYFSNLQNMLIDGALNRIYSWVTAINIDLGVIKAPVSGANYWEVGFTKPISITVDTQRVTNAEIALLQNSLLTYEAFYSSRGKDWKHELRQKAFEEKFLDDLAKETGVDINRLRIMQGSAAASGLDEQGVIDIIQQQKEEAKAA